MGTMWERSGSFEFDNNGVRAPGAKAFFYDPSSTTPRATYQEAALSTTRTHPVLADGNGRWPAVFLQFGSYKLIITTSGGTTLFSADDIPNEAPTDPGVGVPATSLVTTGLVVFDFRDGTRDGYVRCNARTIGSAVSGATERANSDCEALFLYLWNNLPDATAPVSGGRGANADADWAANKTITIPSLRGVLPAGLATMGNSDSGLYTGVPVVLGSATTAGSVLGANTHTLTEAQLPIHAHSVSITSAAGSAHSHGLGSLATSGAGSHTHSGTTGTESVTHTHTGAVGTVSTSPWQGGGPAQVVTAVGTTTSGFPNTDHTHSFSTTSDPGNHTHTFTGSLADESAHTHLVSGNTGNIGSASAHNNAPRMILGTYYIKL